MEPGVRLNITIRSLDSHDLFLLPLTINITTLQEHNKITSRLEQSSTAITTTLCDIGKPHLQCDSGRKNYSDINHHRAIGNKDAFPSQAPIFF